MIREEALELIRKHCKNESLICHMISVEGIMRELAVHFNEDPEEWGLTGLLHDLDYDYTFDKPGTHSLKTAEILKDLIPENMIEAILGHNCMAERKTLLAKCLYASDPAAGLITAGVLMRPEKNIEGYNSKSLKKKFKDRKFAAGACREQMMTCEEFGISLDDFFDISIRGMQKVAPEIGF